MQPVWKTERSKYRKFLSEVRNKLKLYQMTANTLRRMIVSKEISCVELVNDVLQRMREVEPGIHGYITVLEESAMERAKELDRRIASGEILGPLAGVPIALKDNICMTGVPTTCGSKHLENFVPPYDATVVEKLLAADAIIMGKTNMDEFAMGSSTETSFFGVTRNPWDHSRVPGGSSGGSAASVAAGEAICALGTDTGGSIRQPASFCGVVGMKPTYGCISRYGVVSMASSLDHVGPLTKNVADAALLLDVLSGNDPKDATSMNSDYPDLLNLTGDLNGMKLGLVKELLGDDIQEEVRESILSAAEFCRERGAEIIEVSLPHIKYASAAYYTIASAEVSSCLGRFDGIMFGYNNEQSADLLSMYLENRGSSLGSEVKRRVIFGTYVLSTGNYDKYYLKAQKVRSLIVEDFVKAFESCSCLLAPTSPTVPFKLGERSDDVTSMYLSDICTVAANLVGVPAISIPCGVAQGLPIGMQIIGKHCDEASVLKVAQAVEENSKEAIEKRRLEVLS